MLQIFLRAIRTTLRRPKPRSEPSASFIASARPSTSTLTTTSSCSTACFAQGTGGEVDFHEACDLTPDHIRRVESALQRRVLRYFRRHKLLDELDAAGMLTWQGSGGFSVDASVRIEGGDRAGIERLVRYCARPPFALERLHALDSTTALASPESRILYRFPKPDVHGRTGLLLTPLELLEALAVRPAPARPSSPLPRGSGSERQAQASRRGHRSARAPVRGAADPRRRRFTRSVPRAHLPCPNPLGRPATAHL